MAITVQQSGGDYNNFKDAVTDADNIINISGTWTVDDGFTGTITVASGEAITVTCSGGSETIGRPHAGSEATYRLRKTDSGHVFTQSAEITITGMDAQHANPSTSDEIFDNNTGTVGVTLKKCVIGYSANTSQCDMFESTSNPDADVVLENCAIYNVGRQVLGMGTPGTNEYKLTACHFFNIGTAADQNSAIVRIGSGTNGPIARVFNCTIHLVDDAQVLAFIVAGTPNSEQLIIDRSIVSDTVWSDGNWTTETVTDSLVSRTWTDDIDPGGGNFVIVEDTTTSPFDLRLQDNATDNDAQDLHADSTGAGLTMPADDIVGTTRPQNTNFDAGMFEVVAAGPTTAIQDIIGGTGIIPFSR